MYSDQIDGSAHEAGPAGPVLDPRRWAVLALLGAAFFMVILDATIVLTAVPSMKEDLGLSTVDIQWVLTGYAVAFGGFLLLMGRIADVVGRRRMFMLGLALFVLSSLACGLAPGGGALVAARVVQGISAAIMAPTALSLVMITFPEGEERNKALGIWGGLGGVGATGGLLIGGVVTSALSWEWIFFINVPVGLGMIALAPVLLRESRDSGPRRFDLPGALTVTAALVLVVYAIVNAPTVGWGTIRTVGLLLAAAGLLVLFVMIEARSAAPLVPLRMFRMRALIGGNVVIFAAGMTVEAMLFTLTIYAQDVLGHSAIQFGLMSAVMTGTSIAGAIAGQSAVTKYGARAVAVVGTVLLGIGCLLLTNVPVDGSFAADMLPGLLVFGPGMGAVFVASQIAALTGVEERESGLAAGLVDTSFSIGNALGVAVVTTIAVSRFDALMASGPDVDPAVALTGGSQWAFVAAVLFATVGLLAALGLLGRRRRPVRGATGAQ